MSSAAKRRMVTQAHLLSGREFAERFPSIETLKGDAEYTKFVNSNGVNFDKPMLLIKSDTIEKVVSEKGGPDKAGQWLDSWHSCCMLLGRF